MSDGYRIYLDSDDIGSKVYAQSNEPTDAADGDIWVDLDEVSVGGNIPIQIDAELSTTSENPVQNKVVTNTINQIADTIPSVDAYWDNTSTNPIQQKLVAEMFDIVATQMQTVNKNIENVENNITSVDEEVKAMTETLAKAQTQAITDTGEYFSDDTVEGALQEIGAKFGDIDAALDNIIALQNSYIGGADE